MAGAGNSFIPGHEYDLGNGETAVWGGKKGWMSADDYVAMRGGGQQKFDEQKRLYDRLSRANRMADTWDATGGVAALQTKLGLGGAGYDLDKFLAPVRTAEFTSALQTMRNNSPTGGAVGAVDKGEREAFESGNASLNVGQGREQFKGELAALQQAMASRTQGLTRGNPYDIGETEGSVIPQGAFFRGSDGQIYVNRKGAGAPGQRAATPAPRGSGRGALKAPPPKTAKNAHLRFMSDGGYDAKAPFGSAANPFVARDDATLERLPVGAWVITPSGQYGQIE